MNRFLSKTLRSQKGQGMMEYVLIAIVIGLIVLFVAAKFGGSLRKRFEASKATVDSTKITDAEVKPQAEGATN